MSIRIINADDPAVNAAQPWGALAPALVELMSHFRPAMLHSVQPSPADRVRAMREAQRACLHLVSDRVPNQTEAWYLAFIRDTVRDRARGRSVLEDRILETYDAAYAAALARLRGGQ